MSHELVRLMDEPSANAIQEASKFGGKVVDLVMAMGSYASRAVGPLPENVIGLLGGDWLHEVRIRNLKQYAIETAKCLEGRNVEAPYDEISPSLAIPLFEAAIDETRDDLKQLWTKLIAAAMDPNRKGLIRQNLITTVKQMEPLDVIILQEIYNAGGGSLPSNGRDFLAQKLQVPTEEIYVSFDNLAKLNCIGFPTTGTNAGNINPFIAPLGKILMKAVRD